MNASDLSVELDRILLKHRASQRDQVILIKASISTDPIVREKLVLVWDKHVTQPFLQWSRKLDDKDSLGRDFGN